MKKLLYSALVALALAWVPIDATSASDLPPEMKEYLASLTESQRKQVLALLQSGVAGDQWKEGLMLDGIAPSDDMFSSMQFYPGTETVQENEMRVSFMGSSPAI